MLGAGAAGCASSGQSDAAAGARWPPRWGVEMVEASFADRVVLRGEVVAPASRAGEPVTHVLDLRGRALYGRVEMLYHGVLVDAGAELSRS